MTVDQERAIFRRLGFPAGDPDPIDNTLDNSDAMNASDAEPLDNENAQAPVKVCQVLSPNFINYSKTYFRVHHQENLVPRLVINQVFWNITLLWTLMSSKTNATLGVRKDNVVAVAAEKFA